MNKSTKLCQAEFELSKASHRLANLRASAERLDYPAAHNNVILAENTVVRLATKVANMQDDATDIPTYPLRPRHL